MTFRGHVHNVVVVLDEPANLQEGAEVLVEPIEQINLADRLRNISGVIQDLPADLADNHDQL